MTRREAEKILKVANDEASSDIYEKYKNCIATGLLILAKYDTNIDAGIGFEHDQLFATDWSKTTKITPEDVRELGLHGWFISSEVACWSHF